MQHTAAPLISDPLIADALTLAALERPRWADIAAGITGPRADYTDVITRSDVDARIPEDVSDAMLTSLEAQSVALNTFQRIPVAGAQTRFPILSSLPMAQWVAGETGLKQTSDVGWANKYLNIEELAVIVPIPESTLDDASFDVWGSIKPLIEASMARKFDEAVFFGTDAPATFPTSIAASAIAVSNSIKRGTNAQNAGGLQKDFSQLFGKMESDGFRARAGTFDIGVAGALREIYDTTGANQSVQVSPNNIFGITPSFQMDGLWPTPADNSVEGIVFDPNEFVVGVRQDITYKVLDQAVIQDASGAIVFNLAQQDMVALRVVFRGGWQAKNTINFQEPVEGQRYPAAVLRHPAL